MNIVVYTRDIAPISWIFNTILVLVDVKCECNKIKNPVDVNMSL
jgi:hypothetical protein